MFVAVVVALKKHVWPEKRHIVSTNMFLGDFGFLKGIDLIFETPLRNTHMLCNKFVLPCRICYWNVFEWKSV